MEIEIGSEWLVQIAAAVLSLAFSYIPGLRTWYAGKPTEWKSLFMALLLLLTTAAVFGLDCLGWLDTNLTCTSLGIRDALILFLLSLAINQGMYQVSPQTKDVNERKLLRDVGH